MLRSNTSSRSSRWLPPMISPIPGANTSIAATLRPSSFTPHVEGFDGLRVVHHDDRLFRVLFGQITLVLRLQVDAPFDRELEFLVRPFEHLDRPAVIHMHEFRADDPFEFRGQPPFSICSPGREFFWSDGAAIA